MAADLSLDNVITSIKEMAELIGPNIYLQALVIAVAFVVLGKMWQCLPRRAYDGKLGAIVASVPNGTNAHVYKMQASRNIRR